MKLNNIKVGDKIYYYFCQFKDGSGKSAKEHTFTNETFNVIAINEQLLVIDDKNFTTLHHGDFWSFVQRINESLVLFSEEDDYFGNALTYYMYSTTELDVDDIKCHIAASIEKKSVFLNSIDLSNITYGE